VGADAADAERAAGPVLAAQYRSFPPGAVVVGGPAEVTEQFGTLRDMGYDEVLVRHLAVQEESLDSLARLGEVRLALR
jgi:hypothetical protein